MPPLGTTAGLSFKPINLNADARGASVPVTVTFGGDGLAMCGHEAHFRQSVLHLSLEYR